MKQRTVSVIITLWTLILVGWFTSIGAQGPVVLRNSSGTEIGTSGNPVRTDPTGSTTQPVSGTFWQATQPVSGTFWQATQPVSGTITTKTALTGQAVATASIPVTAGGTQIVASNASRKGLILINSGTDVVWLGFNGNAPTVGSGSALYPGGVFNMGEYNFSTGQILGISASGTQNIGVQEFQ